METLRGCERGGTYLANSSTASVVLVVFSFLIRRMLRGGDGHCRDNKSYPFVSVDISMLLRWFWDPDQPW